MDATIGGRPADLLNGASAERSALKTYLAGLALPIATHPLEIAAALEASGCRDTDARELGWPDTFSLAEHIYAAQVVQRLAHGEPVIELPGDPEVEADPDLLESTEAMERHLESQMGMRPQWRVMLRGALFALPGLVLAGALPIPLTAQEGALLFATLGLSWGLGQGLAYGGYMRVSLSPGDARHQMVPWVLLHAGFMAMMISAAVVAEVARPLVGIAAFTQAVYLIAASGLMVLGREPILYALMGLGAIAGIHRLIPPFESDPDPWSAALGIVSMLSAGLVLLWSCRPSTWSGSGRTAPVARVALASHILYGLTSAWLVLWLPWYGNVGIRLTFLMTPLVLSLGIIEWLLLWLRGAGRRHLATSDDLATFKAGTTRALRTAALGYSVSVTSLVLMGWMVSRTANGPSSMCDCPEVPIAIVALGMFLFFAGIAVALFGLPRVVAASMTAVLLLVPAPYVLSGRAMVVYYCLVCVALAFVSYRAALRQVRIPSNLT